MLLYLARTYSDYLAKTGQNPYGSKKVRIPRTELYVLYTGEKKEIQDEISLSGEFFEGEESAVDIKVRVLVQGEKGNILDQYVMFTKVCNEQMKLYGRTEEAILETIRICKDENILREYLEQREQEVVSIMMDLYEEELALQFYTKEQREEGRKEGSIKTAKRMLKRGVLTYEEIAEYSDLPVEEIEKLAKELEAEMQMA